MRESRLNLIEIDPKKMSGAPFSNTDAQKAQRGSADFELLCFFVANRSYLRAAVSVITFIKTLGEESP